ncbi:hypothetical protein EVAR_58458_1 [Eumeta japonica]|uniref:Uncharacterized protein n=1 Tax=Eumeta variegata TaxID=151549 RepID=A0A4C1Z5Q9_EUMVA|nr:hypothetical protein EVAR_58458_1 [Eumeta japonica]
MAVSAIVFRPVSEDSGGPLRSLLSHSSFITQYIQEAGDALIADSSEGPHVGESTKGLALLHIQMKNIRNLAYIQTARLVYFGCLHSLTSYGIQPWGRAADVRRFFMSQKRAIRAITGWDLVFLIQGRRPLTVVVQGRQIAASVTVRLDGTDTERRQIFRSGPSQFDWSKIDPSNWSFFESRIRKLQKIVQKCSRMLHQTCTAPVLSCAALAPLLQRCTSYAGGRVIIANLSKSAHASRHTRSAEQTHPLYSVPGDRSRAAGAHYNRIIPKSRQFPVTRTLTGHLFGRTQIRRVHDVDSSDIAFTLSFRVLRCGGSEVETVDLVSEYTSQFATNFLNSAPAPLLYNKRVREKVVATRRISKYYSSDHESDTVVTARRAFGTDTSYRRFSRHNLT